MQITVDQAIGAMTIATPVIIGWWIKSSLDKLDQIKLMDHKINVLTGAIKELKGEMKTLIEMGKSMAVLDNKATTLFTKYDELNERLNKINVQIQ